MRAYRNFRHLFRDALREAGIEREVGLRLGGWTESDGGSNLVGASYGASFRAALLHTATSGINYVGLNLDHLGGPGDPETGLR